MGFAPGMLRTPVRQNPRHPRGHQADAPLRNRSRLDAVPIDLFRFGSSAGWTIDRLARERGRGVKQRTDGIGHRTAFCEPIATRLYLIERPQFLERTEDLEHGRFPGIDLFRKSTSRPALPSSQPLEDTTTNLASQQPVGNPLRGLVQRHLSIRILWFKHSMRSHLHLVGVEPEPPPYPEVLPTFDLVVQPQRPGELCEELRMEATAAVRHTTDQRAAAAGVPSPLWTSLAIEASRVVTTTADLLGLPQITIVDLLDIAAERGESREIAGTKLAAYALALRSTQPRSPTKAIGPLLARPSTTMMTAWAASARNDGLTVEEWALANLAATPPDFLLWEASAAEAGQTMLEWALIQAARRSRSDNSAAHPAA
jgi:hypothetical protein